MQKIIVVLTASLVLISGCGTPVVAPAKEHVTYLPTAEDGDVQEAVISSLRYLKWKILEEGDGFVIAKTLHKEKSATTKVSYTKTSFSIEYIGSENLSGGSENSVWKRWSHALDTDIRNGLGLPRMPG